MKKNNRKGLFLFFLIALFIGIVILSRPDFLSAYENDAESLANENTAIENVVVEESDKVQENDEIVASKTAVPALEIPLSVGNDDFLREIHECNGFTLCYREDYEQAEWVAYKLTREELAKVATRSNNFHADPFISTGSALPSDYTKSGFDRGHLAPAGDMTWSLDSMKDSFYMSNMSPQAPSFNRGVWKNLEEQVRVWADEFGSIYVISGPILEKPASEYKSIGKNAVSVPEFYYKALLVQDSDNSVYTIGFILPNEAYSGSFFDFAVPIDDVEERTSLDFFAPLDDDVENLVEASVDLSVWKK